MDDDKIQITSKKSSSANDTGNQNDDTSDNTSEDSGVIPRMEDIEDDDVTEEPPKKKQQQKPAKQAPPKLKKQPSKEQPPKELEHHKLTIEPTVSVSIDIPRQGQGVGVVVTPTAAPDSRVIDDGGGSGGADNKKPEKSSCLGAWFRCFICWVLPFLIFVAIVVILAFWIGSLVQNADANRDGSTLYLYQTSNVCGIEGATAVPADDGGQPTFLVSDPISIRTFDTVEILNDTPNSTVAHCGTCGQCSTPQDIRIYDDKRSTLFDSTYACARKGIFGNSGATKECLQERVGFTEGCNDCWVENIMCTIRSCAFSCIWYSMFNDINHSYNNETQYELNDCTKCNEQACGPQFVRCAGANWRRTGIRSEFRRDEQTEVCDKVDYEWWNDAGITKQWKEQQEEEETTPAERRLTQRGNLRRMD